MHEPLPREMRIGHNRPDALGLGWACALVVILAVGFVAIAVIVGELSLRGPRQAAGPPTSELFSGMPLP